MKLYTLRIFVDDWEAACNFYGNVLGLDLRYKDEDLGWAEFDIGSASLAIEKIEANAGEEDLALVGRFVGVSLEVDDIQKTYQSLVEKGVEFKEPPQQQGWGGVLADFKDPAGNILTLLGSPSA